MKVLQPLRTYIDKTSFHASFQGNAVRFADGHGASKAEATFHGHGLCASCPIAESITNLTEVETLGLGFDRQQICVVEDVVADHLESGYEYVIKP